MGRWNREAEWCIQEQVVGGAKRVRSGREQTGGDHRISCLTSHVVDPTAGGGTKYWIELTVPSKENMLSAFFPAQVFAGGRVTGGYSGVKKSKPEPEVEVLRKACLCFSEAIVSKEGEIAELKELNEKLKIMNEKLKDVQEELVTEHTAHSGIQGQVIKQLQEEKMLLEARLKPSMTTSQESQTESVVEKLKEKTAVHEAFCQTEGCTSLGVQEIACQTDTNPTTTLIKHEAGSQIHADTIIRSAVTPERQEMACQTDVEHVSESRTQIVASKSACLVKKTSLVLAAVQSSPADAVNELASAKIDLGIQKKMHVVSVQRLNEAREQNAKLKFANREQTALANKYCRDAEMAESRILKICKVIFLYEAREHERKTGNLEGLGSYSQTEADVILRFAATPERQEMACQTDVEHVSEATTQIVASKSACLVKKTSQAPLVLAAVQSASADAVNELASAKIDWGIQKKMHAVTVQRLIEAEEQNAMLKFANTEQTALADMYCNDKEMAAAQIKRLCKMRDIYEAELESLVREKKSKMVNQLEDLTDHS
eukprot:gene25559-11208_t